MSEAAKQPSRPGPAGRLLRSLLRTPARTFVIYPLVVIAFELYWRGGTLKVMPWGAVLMIWGYLQYRIVGGFRWRHGGGGPGVRVPPQRLVTDGLYAYSRNPMYLGHLIFMTGLAVTFSSWLAVALLVVSAVWFHLRVLGDEKTLLKKFGAPYADYCDSVKRWIPGLV